MHHLAQQGVDTKFVARHRGTIAALLDVVVPTERVAARYSRGDGFAERYGFAAPPRLLRMRIDKGFGGMPAELTEGAMLPSEAARLRVSVGRVVVVENEVTYLAMPVPSQGVVIWGAGYAAGGLGQLPWVRDAPQVFYSGDLDTHGFAILSLLRGQVPQTQGLLMDQATLLAHRKRWGAEPSPTGAGWRTSVRPSRRSTKISLRTFMHRPFVSNKNDSTGAGSNLRWPQPGSSRSPSASLPPPSGQARIRIQAV